MSFPSAPAKARQRLQMHGSDITIQHYEIEDGGSRGSRPVESEEQTVKAYVQDKSASTNLHELLGRELSIDVTFRVLEKSMHDDLRDGGHDGASRVTYHGRTYVVRHVEDEGDGTLTLHCSTWESD